MIDETNRSVFLKLYKCYKVLSFSISANHAICCGLAFLYCLISSCEKTSPRPNIILIMADDLGYETISANCGESYATPWIDSIAKQGVRFEHCHAQPLCTPSRIQIMTGIYNVRNYVDLDCWTRTRLPSDIFLNKQDTELLS